MRSSRLSVPRPVYLLATSLLILVLYGSFSARVEAATPSKASSNLIRVWIVGSPHTGDLPPAIPPTRFRQEVESLGYTIQVETFPARGFAARFRQALQDHNEPEVLAFDNYGILKGIRTALGWFDGIASDPQTASSLLMVHESYSSLQPWGWVVLIRSAINYEAAKTFAMRPPVCESGTGPDAYSPAIGSMRQAKQMATVAAYAYLSCDRSALSGISDESRLGRTCFLAESDTQVESLKACRVSGNRNLAFVSLVSTFSSQSRVSPANTGEVYSGNLGKQSILAVLRNQGGVWRLLAITDDSVNTVYRNCLTTLTFDRLLGYEATDGIASEPAQLRTPDGVYPRPMNGERFGDFTWEPNQSPEVIGQVVEFLLGNDVSRGRNRLFFLPARDDKLSSGYVMWIGRSSAWRVWTISKGGEVAFSRQHTYTLDDFLRARKSNLQSQ